MIVSNLKVAGLRQLCIVLLCLVLAPRACAERAVDRLTGAPDNPRIVLATFFSEFLPGLRAIREDFENETGIGLDVQGVPYISYQMWLHARFLGKNPPDLLLLEDPALAWRYGQADMMHQFDADIPQPNPLARNPVPWQETFRKPHIQQSLDTNGHLYLIPYTQYGVGFFYNADVYDQCRLEIPETWTGLMHNLAEVKGAGRTPFITAVKPDDAQTVWIATTLLECFMRVHIPEVNLRTNQTDWVFDYRDRQCTMSERIDISERIVAFERGVIDPGKAPEFRETALILKDMSRFWRPDFLSLSGVEIYKIFASAKSVHMMNGTWYLGEFAALQDVMRQVAPEYAFDYGVFAFPQVTRQTSDLARAGGINQNAGMRACLMVPKQEEHPWREEAAVALCHYLTLPRVAQTVFQAADKVYDIPAIRAVSPKGKAMDLLPKTEYAFLPLTNMGGYDAQSLSEFWPLWQGYLGNTVKLDDFLAALSLTHRRSLERQAEIYADELDYDFLQKHLGADSPWMNP